jgi:hypothetical protein
VGAVDAVVRAVGPTAYRRFSEGSKARAVKLHRLGARPVGLVAVRDRLGEHAGYEKGDLTGPNPVGRGKYGSAIHLITERSGLPLSVAISGANMHDSPGLEPLLRGTPPIRSRCGPWRRKPGKLHGETSSPPL